MVAVGELKNLMKLFGLVTIPLKLVPSCWITLYEFIIYFIYWIFFNVSLFNMGKVKLCLHFL
jgi:hypothetical protein